MNTFTRNAYSGRAMLVTAAFVLAIGFISPVLVQADDNAGYGNVGFPDSPIDNNAGYGNVGFPDLPGTVTIESVPIYTNYDVYAATPYYASTPYYYDTYPSYFSAGFGFGTGFYPTSYYYPTSTYIPTSTYYPPTTYVASAPASPSYNFSPTTITENTSTYVPTDIFSPTITYAPTDVFTYSPTTVTSTTDSNDTVNSNNVTNSNNTRGPVNISIVSQAAPQQTVQYVSGGSSYVNTAPVFYNTPNYFPSAPAPTCRIVAGGGGYNYNLNTGAVVLSWTSSGANSGYISPLVGTVAPAGSTTVYPNQNTLYTLTVSGNGGTSSCQTYTGATNFVNYVAPAPAYVAPVVAQTATPYVALTQIPYTGFDFGPFGNTLYWTLLVGFAVAASYLVLYFRGGAFALVRRLSQNSRKFTQKELPRQLASEKGVISESRIPEETPSTSEGVTSKTSEVAYRGTKDSMLSVGSADGSAPRIVVLRA